MSVYRAERDSARLGGFVLAFTPGQARIAAHWSAASHPQYHASLIRLARCQAAMHPGVDEVATMANLPAEQQAITAAGFEPVGSVPMFLLASTSNFDADVRVGFQMLDGDVAFLHHGEPQPWL
jgi:hypothetical protein